MDDDTSTEGTAMDPGDPEPRSLEDVRTALGPDFDVKRQLGRGMAATVYLAYERGLDRPVAIKVLHPDKAADETVRRRFDASLRVAGPR